jgi:hypothetical protein
MYLRAVLPGVLCAAWLFGPVLRAGKMRKKMALSET